MCAPCIISIHAESTSQRRTFPLSLLDYVTLLMLLLLLSEVTRCLGLSHLYAFGISCLFYTFAHQHIVVSTVYFVAGHRHRCILTVTPTPNPTTLILVFSFIFSLILPIPRLSLFALHIHASFPFYFYFFWLTSKHHYRLNLTCIGLYNGIFLSSNICIHLHHYTMRIHLHSTHWSCLLLFN